MDNEDIKNICVVCGGFIHLKEVIRHRPLTIYGLGNDLPGECVENDGYYCDSCGIRYEHLPKTERKSYNE